MVKARGMWDLLALCEKTQLGAEDPEAVWRRETQLEAAVPEGELFGWPAVLGGF